MRYNNVHPHAIVWVADGEPYPATDYGDNVARRLTTLGMRVQKMDLTNVSDKPPRADLHVLTGGSTSATTQHGWMPRGLACASAMVAGARRGEHHVMGICLGSQMLAETLWPGSVQAAEYIEVGLAEVRWSTKSDLRSVTATFHYEQIAANPITEGGGTILASNGHTLVQAFRHGNVWGIQFHPELDPDNLRNLVRHHWDTISTYGADPQAVLTEIKQRELRWDGRLFEEIVGRIRAFNNS